MIYKYGRSAWVLILVQQPGSVFANSLPAGLPCSWPESFLTAVSCAQLHVFLHFASAMGMADCSTGAEGM